MGLEVGFQVLKGCVCDGSQRYRGFSACVPTESSGFRVPSIIGAVDGHASVSVRRPPGALDAPKSLKMFGQPSGKDTDVGVGCVSGLPPVEQDSANALGNFWAINGDPGGRSDEALAKMWISSGWHG